MVCGVDNNCLVQWNDLSFLTVWGSLVNDVMVVEAFFDSFETVFQIKQHFIGQFDLVF